MFLSCSACFPEATGDISKPRITSTDAPQHEGDTRRKASGPNAPNKHTVCHEGVTRADVCSHMPENSRISTLSSSRVFGGFYFCRQIWKSQLDLQNVYCSN